MAERLEILQWLIPLVLAFCRSHPSLVLCSKQHEVTSCWHCHTSTHPLHTRHTPCTRYHRGISELGLSKLDAKARRDAVAAGLKAFSTFSFYPEQVDALLYYVKSEVSC